MADTVKNPHSTVLAPELAQISSVVARERGLDKSEVVAAMEGALAKVAVAQYGSDINLDVKIDPNSGQISLSRVFSVVECVTDPKVEMSLEGARVIDPSSKVGDVIFELLPGLNYSRSVVPLVRNELMRRIGETERTRQYSEFCNRVGDIVSGIVRRVGTSEIAIEVGRVEAIMRKCDILPNDNFRIGDVIKAVLLSVNSDSTLPLLVLSRTHNDFLKKLLEQEVPEIYSGVVKVVAISREPGGKAKIAVISSDSVLDPIGACVGCRGVRVRAVSDELRGEKIDVVLWSDDPATFVLNSLASDGVMKMVLDPKNKSVDVIVTDDRLSAVIGRRGQNVRLASRLSGWGISVTSCTLDLERKEKEKIILTGLFAKWLDVDSEIAELLYSKGYRSLRELGEAKVDELASIDGFDCEIASEIVERAVSEQKELDSKVRELVASKSVSGELAAFIQGAKHVYDPAEFLTRVSEHGIRSSDRLIEITPVELASMSGNTIVELNASNLISNLRRFLSRR
jgi:N utilization substance protein A